MTSRPYRTGRPSLPVTWTEAELARAREQWDAREPAKIVAATLHLAKRDQVYGIAHKFGWPPRRPDLQKAKRAELREIVAEEGRKIRRRLFVNGLNDLPTDHLARICPTCSGRVVFDPEHAVRVQGPEGEELYHLRCAPYDAPRLAA